MSKITKKYIAFFLAISFLPLLAGCGTTKEALGSGQFEAVTVKERVVSGEVKITGVLSPDTSTNLTAQISGTVAAVNIQEGSVVKKGDVLVTLDKRDLEAQLAQAQANLAKAQSAIEQAKIVYDNAENNYARSKQLFDTGAISKQQFEQATMQRDTAKSQYESLQDAGISAAAAAVDLAQSALSKTEIRSPIDGIVVMKNVSVGESVSPGVPIITVVSVDNLTLSGNVEEQAVNLLKLNQEVQVTTDGVPGRTFTGKITFISPVSIATGQYFPVKISISNPENLLRAGMRGEATINVETAQIPCVPNRAIVTRDGRNYVFAVKDGKVVKTPVTVQFVGKDYTVITDGVKTGDIVLTQNLDAVIDGDMVNYRLNED